MHCLVHRREGLGRDHNLPFEKKSLCSAVKGTFKGGYRGYIGDLKVCISTYINICVYIYGGYKGSRVPKYGVAVHPSRRIDVHNSFELVTQEAGGERPEPAPC